MRRLGRGGARSVRFGLVLSASLSNATARAEGNPASGAPARTLLEWDAPEGCPSADAVYQSLSDARGAEALSAFSHIRGSIRQRGDQWTLALEIEDEGQRRTRWIQARDCADLADAAAFAIHLALVNGADATDTAQAPVAQELSVSNAPAAVARAPSEADRVDVASVPVSTGSRWRTAIDAGAVLDLNALSALGWGPRVGARVRHGRLAAGLAALWLPPVEVGVRPGQSVTFSLAAGEVSGCYRPLEGRLSWDVCAGVEVGRFEASGAGLSSEKRDFGALWLAPLLGLELSAGLGAEFALMLRGQALAPLLSESYAVNGAEVVYEAPNVGGRFSLGLSFAPSSD